MATAIVRHAGARRIVVTDISDERLALAKAAGADLTVNVGAGATLGDAQHELGMLEGFDIGLEMSGVPSALTEMLDNLNHGARVALLGLPKGPYAVDWSRVITHMVTLKGIYGREMFETWYLMGSMLATSPELRAAVTSVITHRFPAVGAGVRGHGIRPRRQGRRRLDLTAGAPRASPPPAPNLC
jgi:threonine 3-dehydrogenase